MKFREFEEEARNAVTSAMLCLGYPPLEVEVSMPSDLSVGDLATASPLKLAKKLRKTPIEIAQALVESINQTTEKHFILSAEAHRNGYVNFRLDWQRFTLETLKEISESSNVGGVGVGKGKRITVEHTNVNPNKALHIGHARNLVLGDSLARIMGHLGYAVQVLNYVDDSGAQVADVIVGFKFLGLSESPPAGMKFDVYCGDSVYIRVNQEYEREPALREKQRYVLKEIEKGSGEISEYTRMIVGRILSDQLRTCWRLGARYDLLNWESHILKSGMWQSIFEEMKKRGIAKLVTKGENAGCWIIPEDELGDEKVLVRSDGTAVYVAKDIPYAAWKIGLVRDEFGYDIYDNQPDKPLWTTTLDEGREDHPKFWGAEVAISIIDARQSNLQRIVSLVLAKLSDGGGRRYVHRAYEVVALSKKSAEALGLRTEREFVHMAGRKGLYINVDKVLETLKNNAWEETRKRNPDEEEGWVEAVAENIAITALRYELVKQDPDKMIVFDVEQSLKLEGDTGPYLVYSYARARRILEKSDEKPLLSAEGAGGLIHPKERELIRYLSMFDKSVMEAGEFLSPKEVARYTQRICALFNEFYETVPVNREPNVGVKRARLALVEAFSKVLEKGLWLMGIAPLEKI